jgi:hypothetical protein
MGDGFEHGALFMGVRSRCQIEPGSDQVIAFQVTDENLRGQSGWVDGFENILK